MMIKQLFFCLATLALVVIDGWCQSASNNTSNDDNGDGWPRNQTSNGTDLDAFMEGFQIGFQAGLMSGGSMWVPPGHRGGRRGPPGRFSSGQRRHRHHHHMRNETSWNNGTDGLNITEISVSSESSVSSLEGEDQGLERAERSIDRVQRRHNGTDMPVLNRSERSFPMWNGTRSGGNFTSGSGGRRGPPRRPWGGFNSTSSSSNNGASSSLTGDSVQTLVLERFARSLNGSRPSWNDTRSEGNSTSGPGGPRGPGGLGGPGGPRGGPGRRGGPRGPPPPNGGPWGGFNSTSSSNNTGPPSSSSSLTGDSVQTLVLERFARSSNGSSFRSGSSHVGRPWNGRNTETGSSNN